MCCGKSRLEGLETKETLLFNVDKLDRLYLNFRFQEKNFLDVPINSLIKFKKKKERKK